MICKNEASPQREAERRKDERKGESSLTVLEALVVVCMRLSSSCNQVSASNFCFFFFAGLGFKALQLIIDQVLTYEDFVLLC